MNNRRIEYTPKDKRFQGFIISYNEDETRYERIIEVYASGDCIKPGLENIAINEYNLIQRRDLAKQGSIDADTLARLLKPELMQYLAENVDQMDHYIKSNIIGLPAYLHAGKQPIEPSAQPAKK